MSASDPEALDPRAKPVPLMQAEGLKLLVTARKVCFCSQSEKGLKTRETLMTIIDTLRYATRMPSPS